jgi:thymidylate synthase
MYGWIWRFTGAEYTGGSSDYSEAGGHDQLKTLLDGLFSDPKGRRHLMTSWVPQYEAQGVLCPCHILQQYQFQEWQGQQYLDCMIYQRSADMALATMSFNALSYSILLNMICEHLRQKGMDVFPGKLVHNLGNAHIYLTHLDNVKEQVTRKPFPFPTVEFSGDFSKLDQVTAEQFRVLGYQSHSKLTYPMAV